MQITKIQPNIKTYNNRFCPFNKTDKNALNKGFCHQYSAENVKANFLPSFGNLRKVGKVMLTDRKTGKDFEADIKRDMYGTSGFLYEIHVNKKKAGYMYMSVEPFIFDDEYLETGREKLLPEICQLRSLMGDKYEGIGSALINCAIKESNRFGKDGCVWLISETGFGKGLSNYRKNENPIPFYFKMGFKTLCPQNNEHIKRCIDNSRYDLLPQSEVLMLSAEDSKKYNKYLAKHYIICEK